jgi:hypothetical protein
VQIEELTAVRASIRVLKFDAISKTGRQGCYDDGRKNVSLSIETKVAIAVATGFVLMVVGAMAQR